LGIHPKYNTRHENGLSGKNQEKSEKKPRKRRVKSAQNAKKGLKINKSMEIWTTKNQEFLKKKSRKFSCLRHSQFEVRRV
jgi:hypothetical protein